MVGIIIVLVIAFFGAVAYLIYAYGKINKNLKKIEADLPMIKESAERAKEELKKSGMAVSKHYSSMGYKWIEYKTKYNVADNLNLDLDDTNKKLACYMLKPYSFKLYAYADIMKCELLVNNGKVDTQSTKVGTGTAIGGVGVGVSNAYGTARQEVMGIIASVYFKDGEQFAINFTNNIRCYTDEDFYVTSLANAKEFCGKIESIIAKEKVPEMETKKIEKTSGSVADELLKLKRLLDAGLLTSEEFENKKKQLLG